MIFERHNKNMTYRPLDVFSLDALLFIARTKQWEFVENRDVLFVPLSLGNQYRFHKPFEPAWFNAASNPDLVFGTQYARDYEVCDLEHIGVNNLYFCHWRVGYRPTTKQLVVGLDRNDEYVHIERRDLFK